MHDFEQSGQRQGIQRGYFFWMRRMKPIARHTAEASYSNGEQPSQSETLILLARR